MAKKKRAQQKCRKCHQPGHNAKSCTNPPVGPAPASPRLNKRGVPHGPLREIAGAANGSDFVAKARESARAAVQTKIQEELAWARAYVAELEHLAAGA